MDLPTYTNIWRIEKRLYKLYDLRLPMPLPIVWIGVFLGVLAVWTLFLRLLRVPFETPWHVLFLVPPGVVTWLSTRPVIENKRLTELLQSQLRYLGEPRTWCRMAPAVEPDEIRFEARIWRLPPGAVPAAKRAKHRAKATAKANVQTTARAAARLAALGEAPAAIAPGAPEPLRPSVRQAARPAATGERARAGAAVEPALPPAEPAPAAPATPSSRRPDTPRRTVGEIHPAVAAAAAAATGAKPETAAASGAASGHTAGSDDSGAPHGRDRAVAGRNADANANGNSDPVAEHAGDGAGGEHRQDRPRDGDTPDTPARSRRRTLAWGDVTEPPRRNRPVAPVPDPPAASAAGETAGSPASDSPAAEPAAPDAEVPAGGGVVRLLPVTRPRPAEPAADPEPATAGSGAEPADPAGTDAEPRTAEPAGGPDAPEPGASPPQAPARVPAPAGIGAEALRRLRRLAASAESGPAEPPMTPSPPPEPLPMAAEAAMLDAARPTTDAPGDDAPTGPGEPVHDPADPLAEAREQHRRGRPPRRTRPPERPGRPATPVTIRAVPAPDPAEATNPAAPAVPAPAARRLPEPKMRRVEAVVGRDTSGGWRRLAQVVVGVGTGRTDGSEIDEARARSAISTSKRIVVLGCTGGAGQTTTTLMLGHTLATYREDRVLAVDANNGERTLSHLIAAESPETLTSLLDGLDEVSGYLSMRAYTTRCESGLEVIAADADERAAQRLADRSVLSDQRLAEAIRMLDRHYKLILLDPAAAVAARVLPYADQLILVAPASADAPDAIAMTYEWLDGHGCSDLRRRAVLVVNGVSRRSIDDVEQAESVASGRCRAIVRVPWDEELAPGGPGPLDLGHLRTATRRAYVALAGVVASGLGAERLRDRPARVANEDR